MNPIIQQAIKMHDIQDSLIDKIGLLSPGLDKILGDQINTYDFQRYLSSPFDELISSANLSLGNLLESTYSSDMNKVIQEAIAQSGAWQVRFDEIQNMLNITEPYSFAMQSHLADIGKYSALSQSFLSGIPFVSIGNALSVDENVRSSLKASFSNFSESYSSLYKWLENEPLEIFSVPPILSRLPAIEFFNGVNTLDSVTFDNEIDASFVEEKGQTDKYVVAETEETLDLLLARINPDYLLPLNGARESLKSTNPDRARHLSTSLLELFTHILHLLAPDDEIKVWSSSPNHYDKGKPTRRARLLFISQGVNQEPFFEFVEKDIDAALAFLELFQRGTHEIASEYTDEQMRVMLIRMESLLRYLLEIKNIK